jgi:hypothetical protein
MDNRRHDPASPASPKIACPLHPTKTIFDKTNPPVDRRQPKTTTDGRKLPFRAVFDMSELGTSQPDWN